MARELAQECNRLGETGHYCVKVGVYCTQVLVSAPRGLPVRARARCSRTKNTLVIISASLIFPHSDLGTGSESTYMAENQGYELSSLDAVEADGSIRHLAASVKAQNEKRGITLIDKLKSMIARGADSGGEAKGSWPDLSTNRAPHTKFTA